MTEKTAKYWHQGLSPSDLAAVEIAFQTLDKDVANAVFRYNYDLDRWEVYDVSDMNVMIAHSDDRWGG